MTPERWDYIKALKPRRVISMWDSTGKATYNAGRNKAKAARRQHKNDLLAKARNNAIRFVRELHARARPV